MTCQMPCVRSAINRVSLTANLKCQCNLLLLRLVRVMHIGAVVD
jgi:hypothetical protein